MKSMFFEGTAFTDVSAIKNWDVSHVENMTSMFAYNSNLTAIDLSNWHTSSLTSTKEMFKYCSALTTIYASNDFVTSGITDSANMFIGDTHLVGGMGTAYNSSYVDKTRAHIDGGTSNPGYFSGTGGTLALGNSGDTTFFNNSPINKTDVESITFQPYLKAPTGAIGNWDVSLNQDNSIKAYYTDTNNNGKYEVNIQANGKIYAPANSDSLFAYFTNMTSINGMAYFDTSKATAMSNMFRYCKQLASIDLSHFDTSKVTTMKQMFLACISVTSLDVSSFNTSKVTDMRGMFMSTAAIGHMSLQSIIGLNKFDTSKVTDMNAMFQKCSSLTSIDVSHFDTSSVTTIAGMFQSCSSLTSIDLSNFDTSNVTTMYGMFAECTNLASVDLSSFDTSNVDNMQGMFLQCSSLTSLDLSTFNTSNVTLFAQMFDRCTNLEVIYTNTTFVTTSSTDSTNMFNSCTSLVGGNGTHYNSSYIDATYARIDETGTPGYFTFRALSRSAPKMITNVSSSIADGGDAIVNKINEIVNKSNKKGK